MGLELSVERNVGGYRDGRQAIDQSLSRPDHFQRFPVRNLAAQRL